MKVYTNAEIFTGKEFIKDHNLIIGRNRVEAITASTPENMEVIDCSGLTLAPGFIDLQIYGGGGHLFSSSLTADALYTIADDLVQKGTTGFYITLATNSFSVYKKAVQIVKDNPHPAVLGVHLEGPYINAEKKGAHLKQYIKKPKVDELKQLLHAAQGTIKMMTVAPEECGTDAIDLLLQHGVLISAGHSNATFEEAKKGFGSGIKAATHLFNAMSPLHHRDPGLPGAILLSTSVTTSIIPDGIHVDYRMLTLVKRLLGERLFFITDAVEEVREGEYIHIRQKDRFTLPDGTLSGSALTMPLAVKNAVENAGFSLEESLKMASLYPAQLAKIKDGGLIQEGGIADFVAMDSQLGHRFTVFKGQHISAT